MDESDPRKHDSKIEAFQREWSTLNKDLLDMWNAYPENEKFEAISLSVGHAASALRHQFTKDAGILTVREIPSYVKTSFIMGQLQIRAVDVLVLIQELFDYASQKDDITFPVPNEIIALLEDQNIHDYIWNEYIPHPLDMEVFGEKTFKEAFDDVYHDLQAYCEQAIKTSFPDDYKAIYEMSVAMDFLEDAEALSIMSARQLNERVAQITPLSSPERVAAVWKELQKRMQLSRSRF